MAPLERGFLVPKARRTKYLLNMKTRAQKEETAKKIAEKLSRSRSVVFTDYKGLKMSHLSDLRNKLREQNAELSVTKNTLLNIASKEAGLPELPKEITEGPIATLFSFEDEISPLKILVKALKDAQLGKIKGGILNNEFLDGLAIMKLASLPSKLELQAKVVGSLSSPLYGIVGVLHANLRNLVYALDQVRAQKGGD